MARSEKASEEMRAERRETIRRAALKLFAERGLAAARLRDIAAEAGMALGLLYHYYSSKEAVYQDLVHEALDRMDQGAQALLAAEAPAGVKLSYAVGRLLTDIAENEDFVQTCRLIAGADYSTGLPAEARQAIEGKRQRPYAAVAALMAQGQREGTVHEGDPEQLAMLFWATLNGLALYRASRKGPVVLPAAEGIERMFLRQGDHRHRRQ